MAALTSQLEAAEDRLKDLDRQQQRLEEDRGDADRLTKDAAAALARLERELAEGEERLAADEKRRPLVAAALDDADRNLRQAELALAKATADQAGVEAEWRVADAELSQARQRLARIEAEVRRQEELAESLNREGDPRAALADAEKARQVASLTLAKARAALEGQQERKAELQAARDETSSALASAKAELAGVEREWQALVRDRDARAKQAQGKHGRTALDAVRAAPGYERALAAVLGRDAKAPLGAAPADADGRFWTGAAAPGPVPDSLLAHVTKCPDELKARLALVHFSDTDDGRALGPGEWLVTRSGRIRRWDGFVAKGEGAAEAARLEAENRLTALEGELPALRNAVEAAEEKAQAVSAELSELQLALVAAERTIAAAADAERAALRAVDQAEAAKARIEARRAELAASATDLAQQRALTETECQAAEDRRGQLPDPETGRAQLAAAQSRHDAARQGLQAATAALASHDPGPRRRAGTLQHPAL